MSETYQYGVFNHFTGPFGAIKSHGKYHQVGHRDFDQNINLAHKAGGVESLSENGNYDFSRDYKGMDGMPVLFLPQGNANGHHIYCLGERTVFRPLDKYPLPVEKLDAPVEDSEVIKVTVVILLDGLETAHIDNSRFAAERLQFYATPDTLASTVLQACVDALASASTAASSKYPFYRNTSATFGECVVGLSYEALGPGRESYLEKTGAQYRALGLPWHVIGQKDLANAAPALDKNKTLKENGVTASNLVYCCAWLPGNRLQSY